MLIAGAVMAIDRSNIVLIVLCCLCAHHFPYQTLIGSYAILGPAHYLTEVSWLHDRRYFARSRGLLRDMVALSLALMLPVFGLAVSQPWYGATVVLVAIAAAAVFAISWSAAAAVLIAGAVWIVLPGVHARASALVLTVLVPTVIHVFFFTASFMVDGARRSRSAAEVQQATLRSPCSWRARRASSHRVSRLPSIRRARASPASCISGRLSRC